MTLRTLNYGNYGIFLLMGDAGFCPSTVVPTLGYIWSRRVWAPRLEEVRVAQAGASATEDPGAHLPGRRGFRV